MKIKHIIESTTSGAIASVASPMGKTVKRKGSLFKGKVTNKPFYEAEVNEEEIVEQDLILVPGQLKGKDKSFIPHDKDRRDHEVEMARSELFAAAKDAQRIYAMLKNRTEDEGLMGWQQSYITLAADYLNSVADSLEHQAHTNEMTGGVIAGGMSNFEEGYENEPPPKPGSLEYRALQRMKGPTQEDAIEALVIELGLAKFKSENKLYREYIPALMHHYSKKGVAEEQAPMFTPEEEQLDEKKDACYSKVKSRYKVWPSAYASGALVKCRKVGASNWGNKSKK